MSRFWSTAHVYHRHDHCHNHHGDGTARMADRNQTDCRTIGVRYRAHRFARIRLRYPDGRRRSVLDTLARRNRYPSQKSHPDYDAELAMQLLDETGELPTSKHDLVVLLTEYRHALHALAAQALGQT